MRYIPYNKNLKQYARDLRNLSTLSEVLLWRKLRARNLGYQFYRQKPLGNFIVDFYCPALKLIIEIDCQYHSQKEIKEKDCKREELLAQKDLKIIRFSEMQVRKDMDLVLKSLHKYIQTYELNFPDTLKLKHRSSKK